MPLRRDKADLCALSHTLLQKAAASAGQGDHAFFRAEDGFTPSMALTRTLFRPVPAGTTPTKNAAAEKKLKVARSEKHRRTCPGY